MSKESIFLIFVAIGVLQLGITYGSYPRLNQSKKIEIS